MFFFYFFFFFHAKFVFCVCSESRLVNDLVFHYYQKAKDPPNIEALYSCFQSQFVFSNALNNSEGTLSRSFYQVSIILKVLS
jgi:hypothetical protein